MKEQLEQRTKAGGLRAMQVMMELMSEDPSLVELAAFMYCMIISIEAIMITEFRTTVIDNPIRGKAKNLLFEEIAMFASQEETEQIIKDSLRIVFSSWRKGE